MSMLPVVLLCTLVVVNYYEFMRVYLKEIQSCPRRKIVLRSFFLKDIGFFFMCSDWSLACEVSFLSLSSFHNLMKN